MSTVHLNKDHVVLREESYEYCTIISIFFNVWNVKIHNIQVQAVQSVFVNKFVQYVHLMCLCFELCMYEYNLFIFIF